MPETYDVIVAGVGSMGSAACYYLARKRVKVLGLDRQNVPNTNSSYVGGTRVIRRAYQEHPDYVPLLRDASRLWNELEAETGSTLFYRTGVLYMGLPGGVSIAGVSRAAAEHNLACTSLTHGDLRKTYPQFVLPESMVGLFEEEGGYLLSEKAVSTYALAALRHGATLRAHEPVVRWTADSDGVYVETHAAVYHANQLILTAGAWSSELMRLPPVKLRVTRQVIGWIWPRQPDRFRSPQFPVWLIEPIGDEPAGGVYYGFPLSTGFEEGIGLKLGWHYPGREMEVDHITAETTEEDRAELMRPLRYLPDATGEVLAIKVCKYTNSPDGHFIVDRHPESPRVHIACGFSGHGFKFSSVLGQALCELAIAGRTTRPIGFLGTARFATS